APGACGDSGRHPGALAALETPGLADPVREKCRARRSAARHRGDRLHRPAPPLRAELLAVARQRRRPSCRRHTGPTSTHNDSFLQLEIARRQTMQTAKPGLDAAFVERQRQQLLRLRESLLAAASDAESEEAEVNDDAASGPVEFEDDSQRLDALE